MARVKALRSNSTEAEQILWIFLKSRKFHNLKWRRQHRIGKYVLDFYCAEKNLCIELDGNSHTVAIQKQRDKTRTDALAAKEITVLRFWNSDIKKNIAVVLEKIRQACLS